MNCQHCGEIVTSGFIPMRKGFYHKPCWYQAFPYKPVLDFYSVLATCDDAVFVRELLCEVVPEDVKAVVIARMNDHMARTWRQNAGQEHERAALPAASEE